jgi:hypothetical protein
MLQVQRFGKVTQHMSYTPTSYPDVEFELDQVGKMPPRSKRVIEICVVEIKRGEPNICVSDIDVLLNDNFIQQEEL